MVETVPLAAAIVILGVYGALVALAASRVAVATEPLDEEGMPQQRRLIDWVARRRLWAPIGAVAAAVVAANTGWQLETLSHVTIAAGLAVASVVDLDLHLLPRRIVWPVTAAALLAFVADAVVGDSTNRLRDAAIAAAAVFATFLLMHLAKPDGMGFGDVRVSLILGFGLGYQSTLHPLAGISLAVFAALLYGLAAVLASDDPDTNTPFALGPFLAAGYIAATLVGGPLTSLIRP